MTIQIRLFEIQDEKSVIQLWKDCDLVVPWNNPNHDIQRKLKVQPELFLVALYADQIIATIMAGYDGHRGWINYLAVHPQHRNSAIGRQMVNKAEKLLSQKGCPKINLQVRSTNREVIQFYKNIGFTTDDVVSLGKRLQFDQKKPLIKKNTVSENSMTGETDLHKLLVEMSPELLPDTFVFCTVQGTYGDYKELSPLASFTEPEGLTLVIPEEEAKITGLRYEAVFKAITLTVHSSLDAVGLTAAVSSQLAKRGISANVIAAYYHDHILVQAEKATSAMEALKELSVSSDKA